MQNTVVQQVENSAKDIVTSTPFVETVLAVLAVAIPLCFRKIRDGLVKWGKEFIAKHKHRHLPELEDLSRYRSVDNLLAVMQDNTKTDRVSICQFHNGESFSVQNPIFKFTCSHEFLTPGVNPASDLVKRLLVSNYIDLIGPLYDDSYLNTGVTRLEVSTEHNNKHARIIKFVTEEMKFSATRYLFESLGVAVMYSVPLRDGKGKLIGAINFQYLTDAKDIFDKIDLQDICDKAMRVQHFLTDY